MCFVVLKWGQGVCHGCSLVGPLQQGCDELRDHYSEVIEHETENLLTLRSPDWKPPFDIAANLARHNLGRHLFPETVEHTGALLIARQADRGIPAPNNASEAITPVEAQQPVPLQPPPQRSQLTVMAYATRDQRLPLHR